MKLTGNFPGVTWGGGGGGLYNKKLSVGEYGSMDIFCNCTMG